MATDCKALCAEILKTLDDYEDGLRVDWDDWRVRARAHLSQHDPYSDLFDETPKERLGRLIKETGNEDLLEAFNQLEDN